jgi:hypothetical protein
MNQYFKPITITEMMPENVAKVARVLNALKLPSDPINNYNLIPGEGASLGKLRTKYLISEMEKAIGSLRGKRIADIGCGPLCETKETVLLKYLKEMNSAPTLYLGIDPTINPMFLGNQETPAGSAIYLPVSLFELDEHALSKIGKMEVVVTSMFFGAPLSISSNQMRKKMEVLMCNLSISGLVNLSVHDELQQIRESHIANPLHGGITRDFLEFLAQDYCRRLLDKNGFVAHFILTGEQEPSIEMARAAGLQLEEKKVMGDEGTLFCFKTQ